MYLLNTGYSLTVWWGLKFSLEVYVNTDYSYLDICLVQIKSVNSSLSSVITTLITMTPKFLFKRIPSSQ